LCTPWIVIAIVITKVWWVGDELWRFIVVRGSGRGRCGGAVEICSQRVITTQKTLGATQIIAWDGMSTYEPPGSWGSQRRAVASRGDRRIHMDCCPRHSTSREKHSVVIPAQIQVELRFNAGNAGVKSKSGFQRNDTERVWSLALLADTAKHTHCLNSLTWWSDDETQHPRFTRLPSLLTSMFSFTNSCFLALLLCQENHFLPGFSSHSMLLQP
jgi:hypothetical protein